MRRHALAAAVALLTSVLPGTAAEPPEAEQARRVAAQIVSETRALLESALASGPAVNALGVCASVAQNLARRHEQEGWRVRRVSERARNPADAPDGDELPVLQAWQADRRAGRLTPATEHQRVLAVDGRRHLHYMKPIVIVGPVCLQCHGPRDRLAPGVADKLRELYPDDQATGYAVGDLRGAVSVKIPLDAGR